MKLFQQVEPPTIPYPNLDTPFALHPKGVDSVSVSSFSELKQSVSDLQAKPDWESALTARNYATKAALYYGAVGIKLLAETMQQACLTAIDEHEPYEAELISAKALYQLALELVQKDPDTTNDILSNCRMSADYLDESAIEAKIRECQALLPSTADLDEFNDNVDSMLEVYRPDCIKVSTGVDGPAN